MLLLKQIPQDKSCSKEILTDYLRMSIEVGKIGSFGINNLKVASNKLQSPSIFQRNIIFQSLWLEGSAKSLAHPAPAMWRKATPQTEQRHKGGQHLPKGAAALGSLEIIYV